MDEAYHRQTKLEPMMKEAVLAFVLQLLDGDVADGTACHLQ